MAEKSLSFKIEADASDARTALDGLTQQVQGTADSVRKLRPASDAAADGLDTLGQKTSGVNVGLQALKGAAHTLGAEALRFLAANAAGAAVSALQMAEGYKALAGRIGLVVGEGQQLNAAMDRIAAVAQRTGANLDDTGGLFARLAQSARDAGLSTQAASERALALTETINQATQISGASSQAASAAITQLTQALASGVLRGDEFNSVMEQSPRLARALADGLGVSVGKLREMAQAGKLSANAVIAALQSQSATIAQEFDRLPRSVGAAMTNLHTALTRYVAEVDGGWRITERLGAAIDAVAANFDGLASVAMMAGKTLLALKAAELARGWLGLSTAVAANTAATATNTAATAANTAARGAAAAAAGTHAASVGASTAALAANTAAAGASTAAMGRLASIFSALRSFTLVGLVLNMKEIATWAGEAAARLMGARDKTAELAAEDEKLQRLIDGHTQKTEAQTQAIERKQAATLQLSQAAQSAVAEFDRLSASGKSASEAMASIAKGFDLSAAGSHIADMAAALDALAASGKLSASEVRSAWAAALQGVDLAAFEIRARAAFGNSENEAQRLADVLDARLHEAVRRTGLSWEQLRGQTGAAARSAIHDTEAIIDGLDKLREQGIHTGQALAASLKKSLDTADSQAAIETVRGQIERVREQLGEPVAHGLLERAAAAADALRQKMDAALPGIQSVAEAMQTLGVTSTASLERTAVQARAAYEVMARSGTATAHELRQGFERAARAAIAAADGTAPAWVRAQASVRGYHISTDAAGQATLSLKRSVDEASTSHSAAAAAAGQHAHSLDRVRDAADAAAHAVQRGRGVTGPIQHNIPQFQNQAHADEWLRQRREQRVRDNAGRIPGPWGAAFASWEEAAWRRAVQEMQNRQRLAAAAERGKAPRSDEPPLSPRHTPQRVSQPDSPTTAAPSTASAKASAAAATTHTVHIHLGERTAARVPTTERGAADLQSLFEQLERHRTSAQGF